MSNAAIDQNGTRSLITALNTDGRTIVKNQANTTFHALKISDGTSGTDHGPSNSLHDDSGTQSLIAVASQTITVNGVSYIQGVTPVVIYSNSSGELLIQST